MAHIHRLQRPYSTTVWSVGFPGNTIDVRTSSARTALERGRKRFGADATLIGVRVDEPATNPAAPRPMPRRYETRHDRIRTTLLPEARRRRDDGETVTSIAKRLHVKRETLRDWLLAAEAA